MTAVFAKDIKQIDYVMRLQPLSEFKIIRDWRDIAGRNFTSVIMLIGWTDNDPQSNKLKAYEFLKERQPDLFLGKDRFFFMKLYSVKQLEAKPDGAGFYGISTPVCDYLIHEDGWFASFHRKSTSFNIDTSFLVQADRLLLDGDKYKSFPSKESLMSAIQQHFESLLAPCLNEVHIEPSMGIITV